MLEREKAAIGALITLREPTKPMLTEAAATGFYESKDFPGRYPRLQILTIAELLAGKKLEYPDPPRRNLRQSGEEDETRAGGNVLKAEEKPARRAQLVPTLSGGRHMPG